MAEKGSRRAEVEFRRTPFAGWAVLVPEPRGPLSLDRFPFQRELYSQAVTDAREVVVQKAAQAGLSAWAIRLALYSADVLGRTALYTFPTEKELQRFSSRRLRSAIRHSEHLMSRMPKAAIDSVFQKQVGAGWVELRGTNKEVDYLDADIAIFDEYDSSNAANIATAEQRVTGPDSAGLLRRLGVPLFPGGGISAAYEETSDARVWQVKCEACGHWNPLRGLAAFEANVDVEQAELVCADCRRRLDVRAGEWVATYPDRDIPGFAIPKLLVPGLNLRRLINSSQLTRPYQRAAFMNRDLGEPYAADEQRLSREQIERCVDLSLRPEHAAHTLNPVVMGIDVAGARALNVSVEEVLDADRGRKLWVGEVEDRDGRSALEQLGQMMRDYHVWMACIDAEPEHRLAMTFAAAFPQQVYRVDYTMPSGGRGDPEPSKIDDEMQHLSVWRTVAIDATIERFRRRDVVLPPLERLPDDYPTQLGNAVRVIEERGGWRPVATFVKLGGPDDYLHAETFCLCARELLKRVAHRDALALAAPVELEDFEPVNLSDYDVEPEYRPGFGAGG